MNLHFSYKAAKSPDVERVIQQHVSKLEPRLKAFNPDLVHLHGTLDSAPQNGSAVGLNLRLPTGQLFAEAEGSGGEAAVKAAFAELTSQLNRHKDLLRNGHKWVREKGTAAEGLSSASEAPRTREQVSEGVDSVLPPQGNGEATPEEISAATFELENRDTVQSDVRKYLTAKLPRLERFVERELSYREANGQITPGSISREEVIDEVAMAALSTDRRPMNISLEKWIYRLCIHAIRMLASGTRIDLSAVSLEQAVVTPNVTASDESFLQYHQPGEMLSRENVIPDSRLATPEQIAATDEYIDQLEHALRGAKPDEREAFVLCAIEGFTVEEIAQVTDRSVEQVRQSIKGAREHLMKKLPDNNSLKKKLLQYSSVA
jgi:RNA polymerase sigma factor (sigma-70 family)